MRLVEMGHDLCRSLVVDFMHEFWLGIYKGVFTHLVRMIHSMPSGAIAIDELNKR